MLRAGTDTGTDTPRIEMYRGQGSKYACFVYTVHFVSTYDLSSPQFLPTPSHVKHIPQYVTFLIE